VIDVPEDVERQTETKLESTNDENGDGRSIDGINAKGLVNGIVEIRDKAELLQEPKAIKKDRPFNKRIRRASGKDIRRGMCGKKTPA
jgi:hypothetical protein